MTAAEIFYTVPWRATGNFPGYHASQQRGAGLRFRNHVPITDAPDPRRFDVRASLRDPFGQIQVRVYEQSSSIPVYVVADMSASMRYVGQHAKQDTVAEFVAAMSFSAYRTGDTFGFIGCGAASRPLEILPPTFNRAAGLALAERLRARTFDDLSAEGLLQAPDYIGGRRALLFVLSDFHLPEDLLYRLLDALAYHEVVPVVLWDEREYARLPSFGLARVTDPESKRSRLLLMRRGLRDRIRERFDERREHLRDVCLRHGRRPIFLEHGFSADDVSRHFIG